MYEPITIIAGPCALRSEEHTLQTAESIGKIAEAVKDFGIRVGYRGGAWKARTSYWNSKGERHFDGVGQRGLYWLSDSAENTGIEFVDTEAMATDDFGNYFDCAQPILDPERDAAQIGTRNAQAFALIKLIGESRYIAVIKHPQHGVRVDEANGVIQRLQNNREKLYCIRGIRGRNESELRGVSKETYLQFMSDIMGHQQRDDTRNLINIRDIELLRADDEFNESGASVIYDPSHTMGGQTDQVRHDIGRYAIQAITEFGYDGLLLDAEDTASYAPVDGDQALLITTNGDVDWSQTNGGQGPGVKPNEGREPDVMPLTLVNIARDLVFYQAGKMDMPTEDQKIVDAIRQLEDIKWQPDPAHGKIYGMNDSGGA